MGDRTVEGERPGGPEASIGEPPAPLTAQAGRQSPFSDRAARHWLLSSVIWLTVVDLFGLVLATEFVSPDAFGSISWLSFSRVRQEHVNGVILAWLTMMYFGALFYMLPRLCGTRGMWSERLGVWTAWAWNVLLVLGLIGLLTGHSQGREYGELIWPLDIALLVIWSANIVTSWPPSSYGRSGRSTSRSGGSSPVRSGSPSTMRSATSSGGRGTSGAPRPARWRTACPTRSSTGGTRTTSSVSG